MTHPSIHLLSYPCQTWPHYSTGINSSPTVTSPLQHLIFTWLILARASLLALDACLGVDGIPQSATGQASLFTGINVSARIGSHEGPKPTPPIVDLISHGSLLTQLQYLGKTASLLNAFPPRYFESIETAITSLV